MINLSPLTLGLIMAICLAVGVIVGVIVYGDKGKPQ